MTCSAEKDRGWRREEKNRGGAERPDQHRKDGAAQNGLISTDKAVGAGLMRQKTRAVEL